ncbi:hypothetical protein [Enterococcus avium]
MEDALHEKDLLSFLKVNPIVTTQELLAFYRQFNPALPISALR